MSRRSVMSDTDLVQSNKNSMMDVNNQLMSLDLDSKSSKKKPAIRRKLSQTYSRENSNERRILQEFAFTEGDRQLDL